MEKMWRLSRDEKVEKMRGIITGMMIHDCEKMTLTHHFMWPWTASFESLQALRHRKCEWMLRMCDFPPSVSWFHAWEEIETTSFTTSTPRHLSQSAGPIMNAHILYIYTNAISDVTNPLACLNDFLEEKKIKIEAKACARKQINVRVVGLMWHWCRAAPILQPQEMETRFRAWKTQ